MIEFDLCKWDKATRRKLFFPRDWALSVEFLVYCEVKTTTFVNESGEVEQLIFCQNQFKEKPEPVQRKANEEPWIHLKANR